MEHDFRAGTAAEHDWQHAGKDHSRGHCLGTDALHGTLDHRCTQFLPGGGPVALHRFIQVDHHHYAELRCHSGQCNEADRHGH